MAARWRFRLYFNAVAFTDAAEQAWKQELEDLQTRRASFSTGVRGAFQDLWGEAHEGAVASVYAEIAHRQGWLRRDRTLTSAEHDEIRRVSETWCRKDRLLSDVVAEFGPPSVLFGGNNPNRPKTLAYATDQRDDALLCFHLWNDFAQTPGQSLASVHAEPVLLAFRNGGALFTDGFVFTPEGSARLRASWAMSLGGIGLRDSQSCGEIARTGHPWPPARRTS